MEFSWLFFGCEITSRSLTVGMSENFDAVVGDGIFLAKWMMALEESQSWMSNLTTIIFGGAPLFRGAMTESLLG